MPALCLAVTTLLTACNFVDPGEKTEVPYNATEIRLPIYKAGDYLEYSVNGFNSVGGIDGASIYGTLRISYTTNAEIILPADLTSSIDVNSILKETTSLDIGSRYTSERFVYQNQNAADPLYGAMYFIAISNQQSNLPDPNNPGSSLRKFSWAGIATNSIVPVLTMKPVVFANVGADSQLDALNFNMFIDCDSTGTITSSCSKYWLNYNETSQLTSRGNGSYGYFYDAKTYKTAVISKNWNLTGISTYALDAKNEGFSSSQLDTATFCSKIPATTDSPLGGGEYLYLPNIGVVTMSTFVCSSNSTSSSFYRLNVNLTDGVIGGVLLQDIL